MNPFLKAIRSGKEKFLKEREMDPSRKSERRPERFAQKITSLILAAAMVFQTSGISVVSAQETDPAPAPQAAITPQITADTYGSGLTVDENKIGEVLTAKNVANQNGQLHVALSALSSTSNEETTVTQPLDVVMVLDTSGSMAFDFQGNEGTDRHPIPEKDQRITSLKASAKNFIEEAKKKNDLIADDSKKIQIGIAIYSSVEDSKIKNYLTTDTDALLKTIDGLKAKGATQADLGMQYGQQILNAGKRPDAQKVVIFFTDGQPTTYRDFDNGVANSAVGTAHTMKQSGADIYSVGIFEGANPNASVSNTNANTNRFMQAVSSNYPNATAYSGWVNVLGTKDENGNYYLTANTSEGLNKVFDDIFQNMASEMLYPVEADKQNPTTSGYVTFTDTLGDWMRVDQTSLSLTINGKSYKPDTSTQVDNNVIAGGTSLVSAIGVTVTSGQGSAGDTVTMKIPAALLPLTYFKKNAAGQSETKPASPITLDFNVVLDPAMKNLLENGIYNEAAAAWVSANTTGNKVSFLSNAYKSGNNGTTAVSFTPNKLSTAYYDENGQPLLIANDPKGSSGNATNTAPNRKAAAWNGDSITQNLGNNGKLTYTVNSGLDLSKTVVSPEGQQAPDKDFEFTISLAAPDGKALSGSYSMQKNPAGATSSLTFTDGKATVTLKGGESVSISNLPIGSGYSIEEVSLDGFATESTGATGTISVDGHARAVFTNTYSWTPLSLNPAESGLQGVKVLTGRDWLDTDTFTFTLDPQGDAPEPEGGTTVSVSGNNSDHTFKFGNIKFIEPGTYIYNLSESSATGTNIPGVTNSQGIYQIRIVVTDKGDGTLSAAKPVITIVQDINGTQTAESADSIRFTNSFNARETGFGPYFYKNLEDDVQGGLDLNDPNVKFNFKLTRLTPGAPMPVGSQGDSIVVQNVGENIRFPDIPLKAIDVGKTYRYQVEEVEPSDPDKIPGMDYFDGVYEIEVHVLTETDSQGRTIVTYTATTYLDGEAVTNLEQAQFNNKINVSPVELRGNTALKVQKTLNGRNMNIDPR